MHVCGVTPFKQVEFTTDVATSDWCMCCGFLQTGGVYHDQAGATECATGMPLICGALIFPERKGRPKECFVFKRFGPSGGHVSVCRDLIYH